MIALTGGPSDPDHEGARKRLDSGRARAALFGIAAFSVVDAPLIFCVDRAQITMFADVAALEHALDRLEAEAAAQAAPRRMGLEWGPSTPRHE